MARRPGGAGGRTSIRPSGAAGVFLPGIYRPCLVMPRRALHAAAARRSTAFYLCVSAAAPSAAVVRGGAARVQRLLRVARGWWCSRRRRAALRGVGASRSMRARGVLVLPAASTIQARQSRLARRTRASTRSAREEYARAATATCPPGHSHHHARLAVHDPSRTDDVTPTTANPRASRGDPSRQPAVRVGGIVRYRDHRAMAAPSTLPLYDRWRGSSGQSEFSYLLRQRGAVGRRSRRAPRSSARPRRTSTAGGGCLLERLPSRCTSHSRRSACT